MARYRLLLESGAGILLESGSGVVLLEASGAPTAATLRQAIFAWLSGRPSIAAIVGPRIYFARPSQRSAYPCLIVQVPARTYGHNLAGADGTSIGTVEISALALLESDAIAAAEAVRDFADGFRGMQSGVPILACLLDDESDGRTPPPDGSDASIYAATLEYLVKHRVPAPTSITRAPA